MTKKKPFKRFSCLGFIVVALGCIGLTLVASSISSLSAPGVPPTATPKKGLSTILKVSPIGTQPATAMPMIINTAVPIVPAPVATDVQAAPVQAAPVAPVAKCDPAYPDFCIAPAPPDLDCKDIPQKRFKVLPPDPHGFDKDGNGVGCES